jgi:anaerobic selenocysteine-containing dehydrogenase
VPPPAGSELIEEWEFLYGIAQRLGLQLHLVPTLTFINIGDVADDVVNGLELDMQTKPTTDELLELLSTGSRIPLDEVKQHPGGKPFPDPPVYVEPKEPDWPHRLDVGNAVMMATLATLDRASSAADDAYAFRLLNRRNRGMMNSTLNDGLSTRGSHHNPAYMNPDDLGELDLEPGDLVEIESPTSTVLGIVAADPYLRRGCVSMAHCFGDVEPTLDLERYLTYGSSASALISTDLDLDPVSGQPRMSNIPIHVRKKLARALVAVG